MTGYDSGSFKKISYSHKTSSIEAFSPNKEIGLRSFQIENVTKH